MSASESPPASIGERHVCACTCVHVERCEGTGLGVVSSCVWPPARVQNTAHARLLGEPGAAHREGSKGALGRGSRLQPPCPSAGLCPSVPLCLKQKDGFSPLEEKPGLML